MRVARAACQLEVLEQLECQWCANAELGVAIRRVQAIGTVVSTRRRVWRQRHERKKRVLAIVRSECSCRDRR